MKPSDLTDSQWFERLQRRRFAQQDIITGWWQYYDGNQPLWYVAQILAEQDNRFPPLLINWCEKFVDSIDRRMDVEGFRIGGADEQDSQLRAAWQRNDMDDGQSSLNIAALVTGAGYLMIGPDDDGKALMTVEEPDSVAVELDTRNGRPIAGLKAWKSDPEQAVEDLAVLLLPLPDGNGSRMVEFENGKPTKETPQGWMAKASRLQTSPEIPLVPFYNRYRARSAFDFATGWCGYGRSELRSLRRIVDAANQVATNMMAAVEHHALPRKWGLGLGKDQFTNPDGTPVNAWEIATGRVWIVPFDEDNPDAKPQVGQFAASDLRNFHDTLQLLGRIGSGLCDMAPSDFGFGVAENPPSADSIREKRMEFTSRIERICTTRGAAYERAMRIVGAIEGMDPSKLTQMETDWRDAGTPTKQAQSQVAIANYAAGLSDLYQARTDYGYSQTTIEAMEKRAKDNPPPPPPPEVPPAMPQRMTKAPSH